MVRPFRGILLQALVASSKVIEITGRAFVFSDKKKLLIYQNKYCTSVFVLGAQQEVIMSVVELPHNIISSTLLNDRHILARKYFLS